MSKLILTVDDSATMRQLMNFTLTKAGFVVVEASDGMEALGLLVTHQPALVITDQNMPNMDGLTFIERLRAMPKHRFIPALVLTTETSPELKLRGKAVGATGWLVKPFNPEKLLEVVAKIL